jgi:hypothetical protein
MQIIEDKLSSLQWWRQLHRDYYYQLIEDSCRSPTGKWAAGLVMNFLVVTHSQWWLHCCTMLHEQEKQQRLKLKDGCKLMTAIQEFSALFKTVFLPFLWGTRNRG